MRILGIDPGTTSCGWAIIEDQPDTVPLAGGVIKVSGDQARRLSIIRRELESVYADHKPMHVAIEGGFVGPVNAQAALAIGYARAIAMLIAGDHELHYKLYPPATVKKTVAQSGRAKKPQVRKAVESILGIDCKGLDDLSDAYAVAITHSRKRLATPL